jgi:hypothetical protein
MLLAYPGVRFGYAVKSFPNAEVTGRIRFVVRMLPLRHALGFSPGPGIGSGPNTDTRRDR